MPRLAVLPWARQEGSAASDPAAPPRRRQRSYTAQERAEGMSRAASIHRSMNLNFVPEAANFTRRIRRTDFPFACGDPLPSPQPVTDRAIRNP